MEPYCEIHNATLDQLLRWWDGSDDLPSNFEEEGLDEVAFALTKHRPEGISRLSKSLDDPDLDRRDAAITFLAGTGTVDQRVIGAMHLAFHTGIPRLVNTVLHRCIAIGHFPFSRNDLQPFAVGPDERLAARAMVYLSHAEPDNSVAILGDALASRNPRMREYACDEIGDRQIGELKDAMGALIADPDPDVASAAASNLPFFE